MTKKQNDYYNKLVKMLCEKRIPRVCLGANQWLHISGFIANYLDTSGAFPSA